MSCSCLLWMLNINVSKILHCVKIYLKKKLITNEIIYFYMLIGSETTLVKPFADCSICLCKPNT